MSTRKLIAEEKSGLYVGCGPDIRAGFLHCDIRKFPHVDYVCKAWEISQNVQNLKEIYSRHMLEHLTSDEVTATLVDWNRALRDNGKVYIVVPNLDFHIEQWLSADWNDETASDSESVACYGMAGLYGWQRQCDPLKSDYDQSYWDVHKTGFNKKRIHYLLTKTGFTNIQIEIKNDVHLVAKAQKYSDG